MAIVNISGKAKSTKYGVLNPYVHNDPFANIYEFGKEIEESFTRGNGFTEITFQARHAGGQWEDVSYSDTVKVMDDADYEIKNNIAGNYIHAPNYGKIKKLFKTKVSEPDEKAIDVVVWSAGRPNLLETTIKSFKDKVRFNGRLRYYLSVDDLTPDKSKECIDIALKYEFDGYYSFKFESYGFLITDGMDRWVTSPYMFSLEEDFEAIRILPLTQAYAAMQQNKEINQIRFNKRKTMPYKGKDGNKWVKTERKFKVNGVNKTFTSSDHWYFNPALWRMSFIRPKWEGAQVGCDHYLGDYNKGPLMRGYGLTNKPSADWYINNLGVVIWGPIGEKPFFNHLGHDQSIHKARGRV